MFGLALHGWETVLIVSAALSGLAAMGVGQATYAVITLTREENAANLEALERYKADAALKTAEAARDAAKANERVAIAEAKSAELQLELAKRTAPLVARTVTQEQAFKLAEAFRDHKPQVVLVWGGNDPEVSEYVKQLQSALANAGVRPGHMGGGEASQRGHTMYAAGLNLQGSRDANFASVEAALKGAKIAFGYAGNFPPQLFPGSTKLVVGPRQPLRE